MFRTFLSGLVAFCTVVGVFLTPSVHAASAAVGTAQVRQVPAINGGATVEGSIHMMTGGAVNLNGGATITGDLFVPGTPMVRLNGNPVYGGTQEGTGAASPSSYTITLNGNARLGHVIRRTAPVALPSVPIPPASAGTRSVTLNQAGQSVGPWNTLRNLTLNGNAGQVAVPPGTYGDFTANGGTGFTVGTAGATQPSVYNFQRFNLNGQSQIQVLGPVVINLANGFSANGQIGSTTQSAWLTLNIASGGFTLNGGSSLYAVLNAPAGTVIINGNSRLVGGLVADSLIVNGGGLLRLQSGGGGPPVNTAPVAVSQARSTPEDTALALVLTATDAEGDPLAYAVVTPPAHGTLGGSAPNLTYTPDADYHGPDAFTFRANDGQLDSAVATVSLDVTPVNDAPGATPDAFSTAEDSPRSLVLAGTDHDGDALSYAIMTPPAHGTLAGAVPNLTYTPAADYHGPDAFTFTVFDGSLHSAPAAVSLEVIAVNDAPVAQAAAYSVDEGGTLPVVLAATDVDGDALSYAISSAPSLGSLAGTPPNLIYTPPANIDALVELTFTASDGQAAPVPAVIVIAVHNLPDVPVAQSQGQELAEDTSLALTLSATDPDGDPLSYEIAVPPAYGMLAGVPPAVTYTPDPDFNGTDSFTFIARDPALGSAPATVSLTVLPVNDAPSAASGSFTTAEDTPLALTLSGIDRDGVAPLVFVVTAPPAHGTLSGVAPNLIYTPAADYHGPDEFAFTVADDTLVSAPATIALDITPVNDVPVAVPPEADTPEDTPVSLVLAATDAEGQSLAYAIFSPPAHGTLAGVAPDLTYTPAADFHGVDEFTYTASDASDVSAPAVVRIHVESVNDFPVAHGQDLAVNEGSTLIVGLAGEDADGDALTYTLLTQPDQGTLVPEPAGPAGPPAYVYTPPANFDGVTRFTFLVNDGTVDSTPATVEITITNLNDAPVAAPAVVELAEDSTLAFVLPATDPDGDGLAYAIATPPAHGEVTVVGNLATYVPAANHHGPDTFTFTVDDGALISAAAEVSLSITPVNDVPAAAPLALGTAEDTPVALTLAGSDIDGDVLVYEILATPGRGALAGAPPALTYAPLADLHGSDFFTYTVRDSAGAVSAPVVVSIEVAPVNDRPVALPQSFAIIEGDTLRVTLAATDIEGDILAYALTSLPALGTLTLADGSPLPLSLQVSGLSPSVLYTPPANTDVTVTLAFTAADAALVSAPAVISIAVSNRNDAPVADPASAELDEDATAVIALPATDADQDELSYTVSTPPAHGSVTLAGNLATYIPAADYHGPDAFTFIATDDDPSPLGSAPAQVSLVVHPVNDAPVATPPAGLVTPEDTPLAFALTGVDRDGDVLVPALVTPPAHGTLLPTAAGFTYSPDRDFNGSDSFTFTVSDASATSAPVLASVVVGPVNDVPVAQPAAYAVSEGQTLPIVLVATDADGDPLSYTLTTAPALGTLAGFAPNLVYTPPANTDADVTFVFIASDATGASASATVTIQIRNIPEAPVAQGRSLTLAEDTSLLLTLTATDPENDPLTYAILVPPFRGVLTLADGSPLPPLGSALPAGEASLRYTPDAGYHGADNFTFIARDAALESAPAVVALEVTPVNDAPVALSQSLSTEEDTPLTLTLAGTDPDGDALGYTITTAPGHGVLTFADGAPLPPVGTRFFASPLRYTPAADYHGADEFAFTATDEGAPALASAPALVAITVIPVNDAPVAVPQALTTNEDTALALSLSGTVENGGALVFTVTVPPAHGTLAGTAPHLVYTPHANYHGTDAFAFTATDSGPPALTSVPAVVSIVIAPVNDVPLGQAQALIARKNTPLDIPLAGFDADGDPLTRRITVTPLQGAVVLNGTVAIYTPAAGYLGADAFTYVVNDGFVDSPPALISLTVKEPNLPPVVNAGIDQSPPYTARRDGAPTGRIVVNNDEWVITDTGFQNSPFAGQFVRNLADYLTGGKPGARIFAYTKTVAGSVDFAYTGSGLAQVMAQAGHTLVKSQVFPASLVEMLQYDAIFLSANIVDNQLLIDYVEAGGSIYLSAGTKWCSCDPHIEAAWWNAFLNHFGLNYAATYNQITGTLPLSSSHPLLTGIGSLYFGNGNSISLLTDENGETDPYAQIVYTSGAHGLLAVYGNQGNQIFLRGTASDDGKPVPPGVLAFTWEQVSGPAAVIASPHTLVSRVTFGASGQYRFRLTATDGELSSADEVTFELNQTPIVDAGPWQILPQAGLPATLQGAVLDDGVRDPLVLAWSKLAGPGPVSFSSPASASTTAQFGAPGIYLLQLSAADGLATGRDITEVRVALSTWSAPDDLVAWWPFNETLTDQVTGGYRFTLTSLPQYVPARVSLGLAFDSDDDGFIHPVGTSLNLGDFAAGFTIDFWASVPASGFGTLLSFGTPGVPGLTIRQSATDIVADLRESGTGTTRTLIAGPIPTANTPFHVTLTYDRLTGEGRLYIDGVLRRVQSWAPFSNRTNGGFALGRNLSDGQSFWRGVLDELSFYRRPLGVAEVQALYRADDDGKSTAAQNRPPQADAGPDRILARVSDEALLEGAFSDDGLPLGQTTVSWRQVSGPGTAFFDPPSSARTTVRFDQTGLYQLQLVAHDGYAAPATDDVEIRVGVATAANPANLAAWWPLNAHPHEVVNGGHDLELMNGVAYAEGCVAQSLRFDGLNDYARAAGHADLNVGASAAGFTIELWCRPEILRDTVALEWGDAATTQTNLAFVNIGTTPRLALIRADGTTVNVDTAGSGNPMIAGEWQHIVATYDRATGFARVYRNGVLLREQSVGVTAPRTNLDFYLGGRPRAPIWYPGSLDEPSLYSRPLSATEITALFLAGVAGKSPVGPNQAPACYAGPDQVLASVAQTASLAGIVSDDGLPLPTGPLLTWKKISGPGTVSFPPPPALAQTTATFGQSGTYVLSLTAYDGLLATTDYVEVRVGVATAASPANLAAWWPLNAHPREVVNGGHDLELMNGAAYVDGYVAQGLRFDGLNDFARTAGHAELDIGASAAGFSIELWCRPEILRDTVALEWGNTATTQTHLFFNNAGTTPRFTLTRADGTNVNVDGSGNPMVAGQWQHIVATYNRATGFARVYRNGVLLRDQSVGITAPRTNLDFYLGGRPRTLIWYPGSLDEPSLYSRPLSATEINALFLAGAAGKAPVPENRAPVVVLPAHLDATRGIPVLLEASVTDDGLPAGSSLVFTWSPVSGPAAPVLSAPGLTATPATFPVAGEYVVGFTASDSRLNATGQVGVTVVAPVPAVSLLEPAAGATVSAFLPLTLRASASYTGGPLAKVEFFSGATKLGETATPEAATGDYVLTVPAGLAAGAHTLTAKVTAADGATRVSAPVGITAQLVPPSVAIYEPADGGILPVASAFEIAAHVTASAGAIAKVEFFQGATRLGQQTLPAAGDPTTYFWYLAGGLPLGTHTFTAKATDTHGATATSAPVTLNVVADPGPPVLDLLTPADTAVVTAPTACLGVVQGPLLSSWSLEYRRKPAAGATAAAWVVLASGSGEVGTPALGTAPAVPGQLGVFDTTLLPNGIYELRLSGTDVVRRTFHAASVPVIVEGRLKIGAIDTTVVDIAIPAPGIPLRIERRYSSIDGSVGDFGRGSTLAASALGLHVSKEIGADWFAYTISGPLGIPLYRVAPAAPFEATGVAPAPRVVAITLPDQSVLRFEASITPNDQIGRISGADLRFTAMTGSRGTLVPLNAALAVDTEVLLSGTVNYVDLLDPNTAGPIDPAAYELTTLDGTRYVIDAGGGLLSQTDPNGNSVTYTRDAIIHSNGQRLTLTRDAQGRITRVTDPAGRQVNYAYDAAGRLASVTDLSGQPTTYQYSGATSLVTSIQPPAAVRPTYNAFDAVHRFTARVDAMLNRTELAHDVASRTSVVTDALGHDTTYVYDQLGNVTSITNPLGHVTTYEFADPRFPDLATRVTNHLGESVRTAYNAKGLAGTVTDPLGHSTAYAYDAAGRLLSETDALGHAVTRTYDSAGNVLTVTDRGGAVTTYTYDARGNPLTVTDALHNVSTFTYNLAGLPLTEIEADSAGVVLASRAFTYDLGGNLLTESILQPDAGGILRARVTTHAYDSAGRLVSTTHPDGRVVTRTYTADGRPATETTPENGTTTHTYDAAGRQIRVDFGDGSFELTAYDAADRVTSRTDRGGFVTGYAYDDAGRLTSETLPDGGVVARVYDAAGRLTSETDDAGRTTATAYDAAGNPTSITHPDGTATALTYDAVNNVLTRSPRAFAEPEFAALGGLARSIATLGGGPDTHRLAQAGGGGGSPVPPGSTPARLFEFEYDANRRLTKVTHPDGSTTSVIEYDFLGRPVRVTNERGAVWAYKYEGGSAMRRTRVTGPEVESPAGMTAYIEEYKYDPYANIIEMIDGRGRKIETVYEVVKPTMVKYHDLTAGFSSVVNTYDDKGRVEAILDRRSCYTRFTYPTPNENDREITRAEGLHGGGQSHLTREDYDKRGNLVKVTDARGFDTTYEYDGFNRRTRVVHPDGVQERTFYGPGNTVERTELVSSAGEVLATTYGYDLNGRLSSVLHPDGKAEGFAFDADGRITRRTDERGHVTTYVYDDVARTVTVSDPEGGVTRHLFDPVGNLLETTDARGYRTVFVYDLLGRLTRRTEAAATLSSRVTTYAYDLNGNVTALTEAFGTPKARTTTYEYDADNRLLVTTFPDGSTVRTEHDADGNLTRHVDERTDVTRYDYDAFGRLTHLTDPLARVTAYAYPGFGARTVRTDPLGRTYTDHFDSRQRLVSRDFDGTAWIEDLSYDAFGRLGTRTERRASSAADPARVTAFAYDGRGRVTDVTHPSGGVEHFDYDPAGNLAGRTDPRGFATTFTYDRLNRRIGEKRMGAAGEAPRLSAFAYDPVGNLTDLTRPGGQVVTRTHDPRNRVTELTATLDSSATYRQVLGYDPLDRLVSTDDGRGERTFAYDLRDRLLSETDPLGHTRSSTYDLAGNRLTATDERGFTASFDHDKLGRVITATLPGGTTRTYVFDEAGRLGSTTITGEGTAAVASPAQVTTFGYDGLDRVTTTTLDGITGSATYDGAGRLLTSTDGGNFTTTRAYSAGGFLKRLTFADSSSRSWTHDLSGLPLTATDELGHTTTTLYNGFGEPDTVTDALNHVTGFAYDTGGRLVRLTDPLGRQTVHHYDLAGRRVATDLPDGRALAFAYDLYGNLTRRTDQADRDTTYRYDALDRLLSVTTPIGGVGNPQATASYTYDPAGNLDTLTDPLGQVTRFEHDPAGRLAATYLPLRPGQAHESRTYDHSGNLVDLTDGNGHATRHGYDARGLLRSVRPDAAFGQPEILHRYDERGLRTTMTDRFGVTAYAHDARGRLTAKSTPYAGGLAYGYDPAGRLTSLATSAPDGLRMGYGYDAADRLISATDTRLGAATTYGYDAADRLTAQTLPSGLTTRHGYDAMDRLLSVETRATASPSAAVVEAYTYTRTLTGQIASELASGGRSENFTYDDSDRLVRQVIAGDGFGQNGTLAYELDAIGNRLARASSVPGLPEQDFSYDANHAIDGYTYDDQGNPVSGSVAGQTAAPASPVADGYDFRHALAARQAQVSYLYDGDGERVGRRVWNPVALAWDDTYYLNDSVASAANPLGLAQTVEERAPGGGLRRAYGPAPLRLDVTESHFLAPAGGAFSVALAADGTVLAWGDNSAGQLGDGTTASRATPAAVPGLANITRVVAGSGFAAALRADGALLWWGRLGSTSQTTPAALAGLPVLSSVAAGADFLVALAADGTVWTFGDNTEGQLGSGGFAASAAPVSVAGLSGIAEVAAGAVHALALDATGQVHAWGGNTARQLGDPAYAATASTLPLAVPGLADIVELSGGARHTLALDLDGVVYAWGDNATGQLGDGSRAPHASAQAVAGLGQPAVSVAAGGWHSLAALADGTVRAWGSHAEGQTAGLANDQLTPVPVAGLAGVTRVAAGARHSLARTAAGTWYGWGSNRDGQLGLTGTIGGATPALLATAGLADVAGGMDPESALAVAQARRYYGYDAQGSVRYQTDAAGAVTARYDYDAFGTLLGASGESPVGSDAYLYRGERYDALTGLYHLRSRDYDPALGRFHQIDDFAGFPDNPYSLNRYNYAESNPVGKHDPAGRFAATSLTAAVYALHLKDQYLGELATAGPQYTFDPDEALNRYSMTDYLVAPGAPLKLKQRELWVRASGGGLLGSWVAERDGSEAALARGNPAVRNTNPDIFFLYQSGARFRQGWALRQVEQAWGATYESRLKLGLGAPVPGEPEAKAETLREKQARWPDAIYHDALLQATLRSAATEGGRGVRAHFTRSVTGRRYDATGVDLTASALGQINATQGGGPIDWQTRLPALGVSQFMLGSALGQQVHSADAEFARALASVTDTKAYALAQAWVYVPYGTAKLAQGIATAPYHIVFNNDQVTTAIADQWMTDGEAYAADGRSSLLGSLNRYNPFVQVINAGFGEDSTTGESLSIDRRYEEGVAGAFGLATLPSGAGAAAKTATAATRGLVQAGRVGGRAASQAAALAWDTAGNAAQRAAALGRAGARGFAREYMASPARNAIGSNLGPQLDAAYDGVRGALREMNLAAENALPNSVLPKGIDYKGTIHRYEHPNRIQTTWQAHQYNVASNHRYSGPGRGGVYGGTTQQTALKEISHYPGALAGRVPVSRDVQISNILDLTNPATRRSLGVTFDDITGNSYKRTHAIGDWARGLGYNGVLAPSARNPGGSNLVIFDGL